MQALTLYRLFGEKRALLNAVEEHGLAAFVARKVTAEPHPDPVQDLRDAWDSYVAFGHANPAVFAIMNEVDAPTAASPAALAGIAVLRKRGQRVARVGRLERAVALIHAAGVGIVATLIATAPETRDSQISPLARDAVLSAILAEASSRKKTPALFRWPSRSARAWVRPIARPQESAS